jgi:hydrogenase maturation protease
VRDIPDSHHWSASVICDVPTEPASVLVLCLGNDIRRDDGVGWAVADALTHPALALPDPESRSPIVKRSALSGFYLLDELTGYERVIVVDAVKTGHHPPGTVLSFPFEAIGSATGPSPHAIGLPSVVKLGRQSGVPLPAGIHIVAIEVDDVESIAEGLTARVEAAVPLAVAEVRSLLARGLP